MDLRQLFTKHAWWGKLIGAFFGFMMMGPVGALLGLLVGNFFDRGLSLHVSHAYWPYQQEKNSKIRQIFWEESFTILGHIAKIDGIVSPRAIQYAKEMMAEMRLSAKEVHLAQHCFNAGKSPQFKLHEHLNTLMQALRDKPELLNIWINTQYQAIKYLGISRKKIAIMDQILQHLGFAPWAHQFRENDAWQQPYHSQYTPPAARSKPAENAYTLLEVSPTSSKIEVKRAYRRLMSRYHPDKLIAKGATDSHIRAATEKTQRIRKAYEHICKQQGWS